MLIFNTTFHIDDSVHDQYVKFLKEVYIPRSLSDSMLEQPSLAKIEKRHEEHGVSYALQFKTKDIDTLNDWVERIGEKLQQELSGKFGNKVSGFVTLMEEVSL